MVTKRIPIDSLYFIGANFDIWGQQMKAIVVHFTNMD